MRGADVFKIKHASSRRLRGRNTGTDAPEAEVSDQANNNEIACFRKKNGGEGGRCTYVVPPPL